MTEAARDEERDVIAKMRTIGCLLVIGAHCSAIPSNASSLIGIIQPVAGSVCMVGVWFFFLLSGYLFYGNMRSFGDFWRRKLITIIIPWCFTGALVYSYVVIRKGGFSIAGMAAFILGIGSYLWYMLALTALFLIAWILRPTRHVGACLLVIGLSLIVICPPRFWENDAWWYPVNGGWALCFAVGYAVREHDLLTVLIRYAEKFFIPILAFVCVALILIGKFGRVVYYWSDAYVPFCVVMTAAFFGLCRRVPSVPLFEKAAGRSFAIYLLHMPAAGGIANILNRFDRGWTLLLRPFLVMVITISIIEIVLYFARKCKISGFVAMLIGMR